VEADALPSQRYRLTRLHATGGFGRVWLAWDADLGREVALKDLRPDKAENSTVLARFLREARVTARLQHPGIPPIYELVERLGSDEPFYTMRFVNGRTLADAVRDYHNRRQAGQSGRPALVQLLNAFVAVCNTVAYAHSRGVVHRDLKGQNILLGEFGEVIVLDWGLAKVVGQPNEEPGALPGATGLGVREGLTAQGQVLGTPAYMSPEQAEGRLDEVGPHTDVHGLGAILYEILTGQPPFTGADTHEVLRKVREEEPIAPRLVCAEVPEALEAVCLRALRKLPAERYASAAELGQQVLVWLIAPALDSGGTLDKVIRRHYQERAAGRTRRGDLVPLVNALATGSRVVDHGHARGVVYQALASGCFELGDGGYVTLHNPPGMGLPGIAVRNLSTVAPEQARGSEAGVDRRTDVYALGAILYECLTGQPPFSGPDVAEVLRRVREEEPPRPRQLSAGVPRALEAVCLKAMARRPEDRYPTAAAFAQDLLGWLRGQPVSVWRPVWPVRVWQWLNRPLRVRVNSLEGCGQLLTVLMLAVAAPVGCLVLAGGAIWLVSLVLEAFFHSSPGIRRAVQTLVSVVLLVAFLAWVVRRRRAE
ncbi:MAG: protein kinase, partial [Gemmataceae bacterium]|nr:protein kinase [Gemmataceae bacterium]